MSFAFGLSWNLYGALGNFPIPVKTSEYDIKDSLLLSIVLLVSHPILMLGSIWNQSI